MGCRLIVPIHCKRIWTCTPKSSSSYLALKGPHLALTILPQCPPTPIPRLAANHEAGRAVLFMLRGWVWLLWQILLNTLNLKSDHGGDWPQDGWPCAVWGVGGDSRSRHWCREPGQRWRSPTSYKTISSRQRQQRSKIIFQSDLKKKAVVQRPVVTGRSHSGDQVTYKSAVWDCRSKSEGKLREMFLWFRKFCPTWTHNDLDRG